MPVIHTHVSVSTTPEQREALKSAYGKAITAVPGKSEGWLMCPFEDNMPIYFGGDDSKPAAYVEVNVFGRSVPGSAWEKLTEQIMAESGGDVFFLCARPKMPSIAARIAGFTEAFGAAGAAERLLVEPEDDSAAIGTIVERYRGVDGALRVQRLEQEINRLEHYVALLDPRQTEVIRRIFFDSQSLPAICKEISGNST